MWLDWLVFCKYGFSVSALWCPLPIPTVLLGFLLPWAWGIFSSWLLQQSAAIAPYLGRGVSPHRSPSWPSTWDSSSRPSCARAATAPWTWGWSSRPLPLASGVGLLLPSATLGLRLRGVRYLLPAAAPDLGRRVTPLVTTPDLGRRATPLVAAPDLGQWVSPLGRAPWYQTRGSFSQPLLRCRSGNWVIITWLLFSIWSMSVKWTEKDCS